VRTAVFGLVSVDRRPKNDDCGRCCLSKVVVRTAVLLALLPVEVFAFR
jgi:hypothetical protein